MLSDGTKLKFGALFALTGLILGGLLIAAEFMNGPREEPGLAFAERAFMFLFGAIHVVVAAIITVFRRTAT